MNDFLEYNTFKIKKTVKLIIPTIGGYNFFQTPITMKKIRHRFVTTVRALAVNNRING